MPRHPTLFAALILVAVASCRCGSQGPQNTGTARDAPHSEGTGTKDWFVDRAEASGIDFQYFNGMSGDFYFPEMLGGGVGLLDYDNDGDLDVYFAQGQMLGSGKSLHQATIQPHSLPLRGRLYRNDLRLQSDGTRVLHFTDVTAESGIDAAEYGMGTAVGDFDNDGCVDLLLTNLGPNRLYRNNCNGTFSDVSKSSGIASPGWTVSAAFVDYDRDGWLDLYIGNYVEYSLETDKHCTGITGRRDYCTPAVYTPAADHLYHNERNGTFKDVTARALLGGTFGPALGVLTADVNGDGWPDIYVANDGKQNLLWINQRNGTFRNAGLLSGAALTGDGKPGGSMGIDAGDFDNDGDEDLYVTQLPTEGSSLYANDGSGLFEDRGRPSGVTPATIGYTGFGTAWFDFDNDGWLDLFSANGSIEAQTARLNESFPYDERYLLLRNRGTGTFEDISARAGEAFRRLGVGRGAAFGDIDNDGDVDLIVSNIHSPARLLLNDVGNKSHWLGVTLLRCASGAAQQSPRSSTQERGAQASDRVCSSGAYSPGVGATLQISRPSATALWRHARADGSYASANDPRVVIGLGASTVMPAVRVRWPDGRAEEWPQVAIDRWTVLKEGEGQAQ